MTDVRSGAGGHPGSESPRDGAQMALTLDPMGLLAEAKQSSSGRAARTVVGGGGHVLRQTLIALGAGHELSEHENPGEATVQVLVGSVELHAAAGAAPGVAGQLLVVPDSRHSLLAVEDSVVLLTVAKRDRPRPSSAAEAG